MTPLQKTLTGLKPLNLDGPEPPTKYDWILFIWACIVFGGIIIHGLLTNGPPAF
jgi:hypothetical protein